MQLIRCLELNDLKIFIQAIYIFIKYFKHIDLMQSIIR